jgi:integrase
MTGHVLRRASGRWAVVFDIGRDPETGKRRQKWVSGFRTKADAERHLREMLGRVDRGEVVVADKTPFADYLDRWLEGRAHKLSPASMRVYSGVIRNHIRPASIGKMPLADIRPHHVAEFDALLIRKKLSASTRNVVHAILSRSLGDAVRPGGLIPSNPTVGALSRDEKTRRGPGKFTLWTHAELRALLEASESRLSAV